MIRKKKIAGIGEQKKAISQFSIRSKSDLDAENSLLNNPIVETTQNTSKPNVANTG